MGIHLYQITVHDHSFSSLNSNLSFLSFTCLRLNWTDENTHPELSNMIDHSPFSTSTSNKNYSPREVFFSHHGRPWGYILINYQDTRKSCVRNEFSKLKIDQSLRLQVCELVSLLQLFSCEPLHSWRLRCGGDSLFLSIVEMGWS